MSTSSANHACTGRYQFDMAFNDYHRDKEEQEMVTSLRPAACDCVLATSELLGKILSSLPAKNVFVFQRVSKTWNQEIAHFVDVQEKMFLRCNSKRLDVWEMIDEQLY